MTPFARWTSSKGDRRGAQMGVMNIDHPDIEEFVAAKHPPAAAEPILDQLSAHEAGSPEWNRWFACLQTVYPLTGFQRVHRGHG
jgi:ribonucleoside-diphosphate reductase alpha chain